MTVLWWYSSENLSPRVTADFLARQRRVLLAAQYAREHQNQWVDVADSLATAEDIDAAMAHGYVEQTTAQPDAVAFVDLGAVHDPSVIAVGHEENGVVYIDVLRTFQGSREAPVRLAAVEEELRTLHARLALDKIRVESWQGLATVQNLAASGLPVEIFTPTAKSNAEEWPVLAQRLTTRTLVLPLHARLREELLNLTYEVGPSGVRVVDKGAVHQDHAVAVRGVCAMLATGAPLELRAWFAGDSLLVQSPEEVEEEQRIAREVAAELVNDRVRSGGGAMFPGD